MLRLASQGVGVEAERRGDQVLRMVPDHVRIVLKMGEHLLKVALAVQRYKALLHLVERITSPVESRGLAQHGTAAAVKQAANNLVLGIVVGRLRIVAHVKTPRSAARAFQSSFRAGSSGREG